MRLKEGRCKCAISLSLEAGVKDLSSVLSLVKVTLVSGLDFFPSCAWGDSDLTLNNVCLLQLT